MVREEGRWGKQGGELGGRKGKGKGGPKGRRKVRVAGGVREREGGWRSTGVRG